MRAAGLALAALLVLSPMIARADGAPAAIGGGASSAEDALPEGPSLADRLAEIRRRVQRALVYPPLARWRALEGISLVEFEIGADGLARGVRIARSSGSALLDRAAERAVLRAGELPYVWGRLSLPVRFALADGALDVGEPARVARTR